MTKVNILLFFPTNGSFFFFEECKRTCGESGIAPDMRDMRLGPFWVITLFDGKNTDNVLIFSYCKKRN